MPGAKEGQVGFRGTYGPGGPDGHSQPGGWERGKNDEFYEAKEDREVTEDSHTPTEEEVRNWHLYTRLWQDLVHYRPNSLALKHLSRYWALAALFDSLSVSFIICSFLAGFSTILSLLECDFSLTTFSILILTFFLIGFIFLSLKQGAKYYKYQIEDLVASIAATMESIAKS